MNLNIFSDLRKPGLVPGESLSPSTNINSVIEKSKINIMSNRMRCLHMQLNKCCFWCNQVLWSPQMVQKIPPGGGIFDWRWDLQLEVPPPTGGLTSNWRWDLQLEVTPWLEVTPLIGCGTSNWRWHLQSELTPSIGGDTSDQRWDPIGGEMSNWRWHFQLEVGPQIGGTNVTCRNQLFFWKK